MAEDAHDPDESVYGLTPDQVRQRWTIADRYISDMRDIRGRIDMVERRLRQGNTLFQKINDTLFDPKKGLIVQLDNLESDQRNIANDVRDIKGVITKLAWLIVTAVVVGLLSMLGLGAIM